MSQLMAARNGGIMNGIENRNFMKPFSGMSLRPSSQAKKTPTRVAKAVAMTAMIMVFFMAARFSFWTSTDLNISKSILVPSQKV